MDWEKVGDVELVMERFLWRFTTEFVEKLCKSTEKLISGSGAEIGARWMSSDGSKLGVVFLRKGGKPQSRWGDTTSAG
jgi:hypothetical protein